MFTLRRILVPTDFSETSEAAIAYAVELAKGFKASLHVLHVLDRKQPLEEGPEFPLNLEDEIQDAARKRLMGVLPNEQTKKLARPEFALRVGSPPLEIARYAKDHDMDLIVMGTNGRGFVSHMIMGSVAEKVVRRAPCPVLTVRHPKHEFVMPAESAEQPMQEVW